MIPWSLANFLKRWLTTLGYDQRSSFYLSGSTECTKAAVRLMFVAADIYLFKVYASAFLTMEESNHLVAYSFMRFVSLYHMQD